MPNLIMAPAPGERLLRFGGDRLQFSLRDSQAGSLPPGWRALLRTNLGRAAVLREEIILSHCQKLPLAGASWRDLAMRPHAGAYTLDLPLTEVGYFRAKAYAVDPQGRQHWPAGKDFGVTVHPDSYRTANTIYCAFVRMFGPNTAKANTQNEKVENQFKELDRQGYTVIPPSGKLRDVIRELPHIIDTLGCRILHLLPINPTPTTHARFGRFGSPYASEDLTAIDPALIEFDRCTTGIDQFRELTYAAHLKGARVFLDVAINHTGWGSTLQENHPEWFLRDANGAFVSPGAWGTTWEDLVELEHRHVGLWDYLAEVFLTWCRRGVDGFRCDAGYKVPTRAWQYIIARVRQEFPETLFLLEGLGGAWETTEELLTEGGMQWAYSELFQNFSPVQVAGYLDHSLRQGPRVGVLVNYSETHDNPRLAERGRVWSLMRNRLCALTSASGGFGFTCGVEWLAPERVNVHSSRGLAWGNQENLVGELARLNQLLAEHPCWFDGANCARLSAVESPVLALRRDSAEGKDSVLVLANTDVERPQTFVLDAKAARELGPLKFELLNQPRPPMKRNDDGAITFTLEPGAAFCLAATATPQGLSGEVYRRARAQAAWAFTAMSHVLPTEDVDSHNWLDLAKLVENDAAHFLATLSTPRAVAASESTAPARTGSFSSVVAWRLADRRRVTLVPPGHWLLLQDTTPFRATLVFGKSSRPSHIESIGVRDGHIACFSPNQFPGDAKLLLEHYAEADQAVTAAIRFLPLALPVMHHEPRTMPSLSILHPPPSAARVLLTNGRGGMARLGVDLGHIASKYDCLLGANLHPAFPVDRHIFAKRARVWVVADGFISPLSQDNLLAFESGPPARWQFVANAGDGRSVEIELVADMLDQQNTTVLRFHRPAHAPAIGKDLPEECDVRLTVRVDIEDRNFHSETKRSPGADEHFAHHSYPLAEPGGFAFTPAADRQLRVFADRGRYHHEPEWCENIPHPVEHSRGQTGSGDAYSPGWFDLPLSKGTSATLVVTAETDQAPVSEEFIEARCAANEVALRRARLPDADSFGQQLVLAAQQFVVRRGDGKTIVAGYPWFLDWGRDTLIAARGLLAAGMVDEVQQLLVTFGRFVENGTLPNIIHGENASNRDTSDAPLWYGIVCEELALLLGDKIYEIAVDQGGRTIAGVLREIANGYLQGTPNHIRMDPASGLVWSPKHFTWMDTNFPAGTPREGYPVEIQVLWIRLLQQLGRLEARSEQIKWTELANLAETSLQQYFWLEERGYLADLLIAEENAPAAVAIVDRALRSNCLFAVSLGLLIGEKAQRCVEAAQRYLVVPGALRSLAPLPVSPPLAIYGNDGRLLNDPPEPYWGRYEGDEDTRRKPAYHNGTAWTWTFPVFCEALARAWEFSPAAVASAQAYLRSMEGLLQEGCAGQIPEVLDGDAPHQQRGCDAQAWGVTEALRVWKLLQTA